MTYIHKHRYKHTNTYIKIFLSVNETRVAFRTRKNVSGDRVSRIATVSENGKIAFLCGYVSDYEFAFLSYGKWLSLLLRSHDVTRSDDAWQRKHVASMIRSRRLRGSQG